jgi:hypothetical protein
VLSLLMAKAGRRARSTKCLTHRHAYATVEFDANKSLNILTVLLAFLARFVKMNASSQGCNCSMDAGMSHACCL